MKVLVIGDVHATHDELDDCQALIDYVQEKAKTNLVDFVLFLGDQHHTHSILRVEVIDFWKKSLQKLTEICPVYLLVGNHDRVQDRNSQLHSMVYGDLPKVNVVDKPIYIKNMAFLPWTNSEQEFQSWLPEKDSVVFCHQTFDGSKYENGFYAKDGFEIPDDKFEIISGHIHTPQKIKNVSYVGVPRWRTSSDANIQRNIYLLNIQDAVVNCQAFPLEGICKGIYHFLDTVGEPLNEVMVKEPATVTVYIKGPKEFVDVRRDKWSKHGYLTVCSIDSPQASNAVSESLGLDKAFKLFFEKFEVPLGTSKDTLQQMIQKRGIFQ